MNSDSRVRIAILRHGNYPQDVRVYKEVLALKETGYDITVFCLRNPNQKSTEDLDKIHVYRLPLAHRRGSMIRYFTEYISSTFLFGWKMSRREHRNRYDIVQVNTIPDFLVFASIVPRCFGSRILLDMHEPAPELYETKYGTRTSRLIRKLLVIVEKLAIRFAHHVLTVNNTIRNRFIERGAPAEKITVVRNVPTEDIFNRSERRTRTSSHFLLITHGTLQPRYGHETLIKAVSRLRVTLPEIRLQIIGNGESRPELQKLTKTMNCEDIIEFLGYIPFKDIPDYLDKADVGVIPLNRSPFSELCQPNKLFEYVALKIPVITARVQAIEESFDESCVRFFEPGNHEDLVEAVLDLYRNPEKRRTMAERAYQKYQLLRWDVSKNIYIETIKHLVRS